MSRKALPMFEEDESSAGTDSTADSEARSEYNVDGILADRLHPENGPEYLIKWSGYPLYRATWEVSGNIMAKDIITNWRRTKEDVKQGRATAFDVDDWHRAVEDYEDEKSARQARRKQKRVKRRSKTAVPDLSNDDESDAAPVTKPRVKRRSRTAVSNLYNDDDSDAAPVTKPRVKQPPPIKRKGVAQKILKKQGARTTQNMVDDDPDMYERTSEPDSLFDGSIGDLMDEPVPASKASPKPQLTRAPTSHPEPLPKKQKVPEASKKKQAMKPPAVRKMSSSVSSPPAKNVNIFGNTAAESKRKQLPRVSGDTPKDSSEPLFQRLSQQNRFQKYSRNERAPDPSALTIVDPKTGRIFPPKTVQQTASMASAPLRSESSTTSIPTGLPAAYSRRSPPPAPKPRADSHGTLGRARNPQGPGGSDGALDTTVGSRDQAAAAARGSRQLDKAFKANAGATGAVGLEKALGYGGDSPTYAREKTETCWYWQNGNCQYSEENCRWAHRVIEPGTRVVPHIPNSKLTCWYWRTRGRCTKTEQECEYAHFDTGIHADAPRKRMGSTSDAQNTLAINKSMRMEPAEADLPPSSKTCYFWHTTGKCTPPNGICKFAHYDTDVVAAPPGAYRKQFQPTTKLSDAPAAPQQRQSAAVPHVQAILEFKFQGVAAPVRLQAKLEPSDMTKFAELIGNKPLIHIDRTITAMGLNLACGFVYWSRHSLDNPTPVAYGGISIEHDSTIEKVLQICRLTESGFVGSVAGLPGHSFPIVIHPSGMDAWRHAQPSEFQASKSPLQFYMWEKLKGIEFGEEDQMVRSIDQDHAAAVLQQLKGLDVNRLLPVKDLNNPYEREGFPVFVKMPPTLQIDTKLRVDFFRALGCEVYTEANKGGWSYFRKRFSKASLIVVHPEQRLWEMEGLHELVYNGGQHVQVFSIGINRCCPPPIFECERLFPHGGAIFITDDVFEYHPEQAIEIIDAFLNFIRYKPNWRLCARPGLYEWADALGHKNKPTAERHDLRWAYLFQAVNRMFPPEDEDYDNPPNPPEDHHFVSTNVEYLPSFKGLWERDETAATNLMVEWFGGWALENVKYHRKFVVFHVPKDGVKTWVDESGIKQEELDPRGWMKQHQHIGVYSKSSILAMLSVPKQKK